MKEPTTGERLHRIGDRLDEFAAELRESRRESTDLDYMKDQFQVGYFVHHTEIAWLWRQHIELIKYAEDARKWMMGEHVDDLSLKLRNQAIAIRINIEGYTK